MSIEFPLLQKGTPLGPISEPKIPVGPPAALDMEKFRSLIDCFVLTIDQPRHRIILDEVDP